MKKMCRLCSYQAHSLQQSGGGLAEHAVASVKLAVRRPPGVSAADGAGLPIAAGTALQSLRSIGARFDSTSGSKPLNVLVTAASGGVGHYAVQLAKLAGLHVTATCGARNAELVRGLGADEVLDYGTPDSRGRRHAEPVGAALRRRRTLRGRGRLAGVRAAAERLREGGRHHGELRGGAHGRAA